MADQKTDNTPRSRMELRAPKALTDKLMDYIAPDSGWVLITDCDEYGDALPDVIRDHPDTKFVLTVADEETAKELADVYDPLKNAELITANICEQGFTDKTFDLIISIPPFARRRRSRDENFPIRDENLATLQNLIGLLNEGGELVIILMFMIMFGRGSVAQMREYIESHYRICEIDILPEGLFRPFTAARTYLFVFSTGETDSVLLRQYEPDRPIRAKTPCEELILGKEKTLSKKDFEKLNGWNVDQAFAEDTEERKAYGASTVPKVIMKDAATVFRGKAVNTKEKEGRIGVINISDIKDTGIDYSHMDRMDAEDRKIEKYLLEDGDVLVSSRGTIMKIAVVEEAPMRCIPSVNLIAIRPGNKIRGTYLKMFLESPVGTQMLESLQRGGAVMNINYQDVAELEIPAPPLEVQDELIAKYNAGLKAYTDTVTKAEKKWNKTRQEVQNKLF